MGFRGIDAPLTTTERKIKADRGAVVRFMQAYLETIHYFKTNKAGTARILQKYMRGVSEEDIRTWCDDLRADYQAGALSRRRSAARGAGDDERAEVSKCPPGYINNSILDELKKKWFYR